MGLTCQKSLPYRSLMQQNGFSYDPCDNCLGNGIFGCVWVLEYAQLIYWTHEPVLCTHYLLLWLQWFKTFEKSILSTVLLYTAMDYWLILTPPNRPQVIRNCSCLSTDTVEREICTWKVWFHPKAAGLIGRNKINPRLTRCRWAWIGSDEKMCA